jgi:sugar phosphate permease
MTSVARTASEKTAVRPTRVRYVVVGFAVALAMVTYLDRVCISNLAPNIMADLGLTKQQMNFVFSAFTLAYALFEIPTARWADRRGTRGVLTRIVAWWSGFTIATAGAFNFASLLVTRFLFGAGEAGAWPSATSTFSRWIPAKERGTVQGVFFAGAHLSGGLTPMLVAFLIGPANLGWRAIFALFGLVGLVWAVAWYCWFRDDPAEDPRVNEAELAAIVAGRTGTLSHHASWAYWRRLAVHRNTLPLCLMYIGNTSPYYFLISWMPTYLNERWNLTAMWLGFSAGLPMTLSVLGDLFGGVTTDRLSKRFGLKVGRSGVGAFAYFLAAVSMILAASAPGAIVAVGGIALAVAASMFTLGAAWGTCLDIGGKNAGVVSAAMNTAGALSGFFIPFATTFLKDRFGTWDAPLYMMGTLFLVGTLCWLLIDPRKRVFD